MTASELAVGCPRCLSLPHMPCLDPQGKATTTHLARINAAADVLACGERTLP